MIILLCTDDNYVQHCAATIISVLKHNENVIIYLFSTGISAENNRALADIAAIYNAEINIILIEESLILDFPMSNEASSHISVATYFRLFVELKLPKTIDKVIYLDSDMIVRTSLLNLWQLPMDNQAVGAVYQNNEWAKQNDSFKRLNYPERFGYFNAGLLVINLKYWRAYSVTRRLFDFINVNFNNIVSHDQDTLNAVLFAEVLPLDCKWNFLPFFYDEDIRLYTFPHELEYLNQLDVTKNDPSIVHFVFKPKPWEYGCRHPFRDEYIACLKNTSWSNYKVTFDFVSWWNYYFIKDLLYFRRRFLKKLNLKK
jgi:lipopolysaccharide biosynthesis glycosyltransferase